MPVVKLAPIARKQYTDNNGDPVVGGKLFTYAAGSTTKQTTYTDSTGTTANTNPIILDAAGRTPYGVFYESGLVYKEVLAIATDTDPPTSPVYTADVLVGVNDTTSAAALAASSQWVASGLTPTYVSATQFTLVGDQTAAFHVGRRLRFTVTAGTLYGRISVTAFGALTTVTVVLDSGVLDAGLSAVDVGILTALNESMPEPSSVGYQPLDGLLTALAAQTTAAAKVQGYTGADACTLYDFKDEDNMASDSATAMPSQQSVKAYVTASIAAIPAAITSGTVQASTSGTAIDFTSLPAGVQRITVMAAGVSSNGTSAIQVQLGDSGGIETTGYLSGTIQGSSGAAAALATIASGLYFGVPTNASAVMHGVGVLVLIDASTNTWCWSANISDSANDRSWCASGSKSLSATLTQVRFTSVSGDTLDLGKVNILYE